MALFVGALALGGSAAAVFASTGQAAPGAAGDPGVCQGLATALANNERFIAGQRAEPDAQSEARIANREAVIEEIRRKQAASGCGEAELPEEPPAGAAPTEEPPAGQQPPAEEPPGEEPPGAEPPAAGGEVVCAGSTVTLSGEAGAPAASSGQFPVGTVLKVTNLDNAKSTTVEVTSASGSCALLNNAAFEQVREPGKFLIRNARIERVG
ncbi:hypothetical protein ACIBI4_28115 [Streptomyces sp. NPDC050418]|uniref:hypothetical protein n=1 Tax=Streptomyces sp. NPDC050418 TaxID=3365612 RepID=UPI0037BC719F